ncbi:MAG: hypothetical protein GX126_04495 [Bacteroidales bacterium]|nr:hypothetical protein [Bacteroidales bacterium]
MSATVRWDGFLIEYITIRNGKERIKITMRNLVCLEDQLLMTLYEKLRLFYSPFRTAAINAPGKDLILIDINNNELHLNGCHCGTEPGTEASFLILNRSGFKVSRTWLGKARAFFIQKPDLSLSHNWA